MKNAILILLLSATVLAFTIVNTCNAPQDYVNALRSFLQQAYDMYTQDIKAPALCPDFRVELRNDIQYPAVTYSRIGPFGACAYKMEFRCDISRAWLQHLAFHEMAHALQNSVGDGGKGYGWWSEAHAEGLASYYMVERIYQVGRWQRYGWVQDFWDRQLYRQDPWRCEAPNLCAYQYGAFFAWLAWRYSPLNATLTYAFPMSELRKAYWNFLLSPWAWGRDPMYLDFDECVKHMEPNTALYCVYSPVLPNRVYVFSSQTLINATGLPDKILIALVATRTSDAGPSVTVSHCPEQTTTVTVTTTSTVTHTVTETYTTTAYVTHTTTVPVTYTVTVTLPVTYTVTETVTVPVTYTTTAYVTHTVAVPITYTTTATHTVTATETVTVSVHHTTTVTETETMTVPVTYTYTTTETVTYTTTVAGQESGACTWCIYGTLAVVILLIVCLTRCRNTSLNNRKRFNKYGSTVYT